MQVELSGIDVMVTGSPRTLNMPEVTDTQSVLIQAKKPTKAMFSSMVVQGGANPAAGTPQLITSHHREQQERESMKTAERGTLKWARGLA